MNLQVIVYLIYLTITLFIIFKVGLICYTNGRVFIMNLLPHANDTDFGLRTNKMLLIGYYLINIGYATLILSEWNTIDSVVSAVESIAKHTAKLICILAALHYFNLFWISKFIKNFK